MTSGALIFAYNNEQIDYLSLARWSAANIHRHLGIPTAIVTDQDFEAKDYEHIVKASCEHTNRRWFDDFEQNVVWRNQGRVDSYELSPWDRTLVLDADYVVASDRLKILLNSNLEFACHDLAYDLTNQNDFSALNVFGLNAMPMSWATVMFFRRCDHSRLIFETMQMIRQNWNHYKTLYHNHSPSYRNDHALSIALLVVNGHTFAQTSVPWKLASLTPRVNLQQIDPDHYRVTYATAQGKQQYLDIQQQDFHAMGKQQLGEIVANYS
jgi:hypothetical protein